MLKALRKLQLERVELESNTEKGLAAVLLEGCIDPASPTGGKLHHHTLQDSDIEPFFNRKDGHSLGGGAPGVGGFKILFCAKQNLTGLAIGTKNYELIERAFQLPLATMACMGTAMGHCIRIPPSGDDKSSTRSLVFKNAWKFQLGDWLLSLTFDPASQTSFAFVCGKYILSDEPDPMRTWLNTITRVNDPTLTIFPEEHGSLLPTLISYLRQADSHWNHPLFIPTLLFTIHMDRMREHNEKGIDRHILAIEEALGVSRNRNYATMRADLGVEGGKFFENNDFEKLRVGIKTLTTRINVTLMETIMFDGNTNWQIEASRFLLDTLDEWESSGFIDPSLDVGGELRETLIYLSSLSQAMQNRTIQVKQRLESQMSVLYSLIAQTDNRLNAQMAASTGRDSAAMKTLAFLAALFLPGTFVATLFSMSMFDWQSGRAKSNLDDDTDRVVSPYFWIYWVVAVPLTAFVIGGWRLWWTIEKRAYDRDISKAIYGSSHQTKASIPVESNAEVKAPVRDGSWAGFMRRKRRFLLHDL